jgi:hypothetical protein
LEKEKHYTGNHDLGFYDVLQFLGSAYRITNNTSYKTAIDTAALSLATRYRPGIRSIQSWDGNSKLKCPLSLTT